MSERCKFDKNLIKTHLVDVFLSSSYQDSRLNWSNPGFVAEDGGADRGRIAVGTWKAGRIRDRASGSKTEAELTPLDK